MQQTLSFKITGYLIAPHEWLRIGAYKLIGKRYRYHLGDHHVGSAEELTFGQKLFCLLMPLGVGLFVALALATTWGFTLIAGQYPRTLPDYLWQAPLWHHLLHLTWLAVLGYTMLFSCYDVISAYHLLRIKLRNRPPEQPHRNEKPRNDNQRR